MSIAQRIAALKKQREDKMAALSALVDKAATGDSPRAFTDEERTAFDTLKKEVNGIDAQVTELLELEQMTARGATAIVTEIPGNAPAQPQQRAASTVAAGDGVLRNVKQEKGIATARFIMALAAAGGNRHLAAQIADQHWKDVQPEIGMLLRAPVAAGSTTAAGWAAELVQNQTMNSEFIELLRPLTLFGRLQAKMRKVPFNIRIPRQLTGVTAKWVGQGLSKPVGNPTFDAVTFPWAKMAIIVPLTKELIKFSDPSAEVLVRDSMAAGIAEFIDNQFIDSAVSAVANLNPASITNGITPTGSASADATPTVAEAQADLLAAIAALNASGVPPKSPVWIMSLRTFTNLSMVRTAQDIFAFREELGRMTLFGIPVEISSAINTNLGAGTASEIVLVDLAEIMYADDGAIEFDMSGEASLQLDSAPATPPTPLVSLWQQNMIAIKAEKFLYWARRRDSAVAVVNAVLY